MAINEIVYDQLLAQEHKWRINGELQVPHFAVVNETLQKLIDYVKKSPTPISIEQGGILVKSSDGHIDVYVYAGEV